MKHTYPLCSIDTIFLIKAVISSLYDHMGGFMLDDMVYLTGLGGCRELAERIGATVFLARYSTNLCLSFRRATSTAWL